MHMYYYSFSFILEIPVLYIMYIAFIMGQFIFGWQGRHIFNTVTKKFGLNLSCVELMGKIFSKICRSTCKGQDQSFFVYIYELGLGVTL